MVTDKSSQNTGARRVPWRGARTLNLSEGLASRALRTFGNEIWVADGLPVRFGFAFLPTRMIVVRLNDGSLWVNSPVEADDALFRQIDALGPVRYLVAPTRLHLWRLEQWQRRYSHAELWGPHSKSKRGRTAWCEDVLRDRPPQSWETDIDQLVFRGNVAIEEVEFLHKRSHTLIMTDFIQNYAPERYHGFVAFLLRLEAVSGGGVPRDIQFSFLNRKRARASLAKLLSWDFDKLIVAHGECVEHDARRFVERAFRWLMP